MDALNTECCVIEVDEKVSEASHMPDRVDFHMAITGGGLGDVVVV
jgi:hypothetical protein